MNKHCTNPSCRKTFSTLNYGGQCPFCGKTYPQLDSARKDGRFAPVISTPFHPLRREKAAYLAITIVPQAGVRKRKRCIKIPISDVLALAGEKIKGIKALRNAFVEAGYAIGLKDAKDLFEAIISGHRLAAWHQTGDEKDGIKELKPIPVKTPAQNPVENRKEEKTASVHAPVQSRVEKKKSTILDTPIEGLDLSVRAYNCLKRAGISTVRDLAGLTRLEMVNIRNLGAKSQGEIEANLHERGIRLYQTSARYEIGDTLQFGWYRQEKGPSTSTQAIDWLVLAKDHGTVTLISKYALDAVCFNEKPSSVSWKDSTVRAWLNGEFLHTAFTADQQALLKTVCVPTGKNSSTEDKVFLLSLEEAKRYFASNADRMCLPSPAAVEKGGFRWGNSGTWWWLRTSGQLPSSVVNVGAEGTFNFNGNGITRSDGTVRPVIVLQLS